MNPRLVLSLWRERWGKPAGASFKVPYVRGKVNQWTGGLPYVDVWDIAGVPTITFVVCLVLMGFMIGAGLSLYSQIVFSVFWVSVALYARRYAGTLITLVLVAMTVIASSRYLYWRFNQTLVQDFSLDFIFGFYFWVAECYLALLVSTGLIQSIWPLRRACAPLPPRRSDWPTVDIFILCDDQPHAAIKLTAAAAQQLDWPKKKINIYLVDAARRDDLKSLSDSFGASYLPYAEEATSPADFINLALPLTSGELVAVFECGQTPDEKFLQSTIGWLLRDEKLGLIQTPHHLLAPAPSKQDLEVFEALPFSQSCAVLRRVALVEANGVDASPTAQHAYLAFKLHAAGYGTAYIGFREQSGPSDSNQLPGSEPSDAPVPEVFLVEHPFFGRTLLWKHRLASFHKALLFYYPIPQLLFFAAPLVYLLGHIQIIQASVELFAAYALPHFINAYIARARTQGRDRFTLIADIKETVLAWYLLVLTTWALLRTKLGQCLNLLRTDNQSDAGKARSLPLFGVGVLLPYLFALSLSLAGFFSGLFPLLFSETRPSEANVVYLLWVTYNLMLLLAMLAVAEEARQVLKHTRDRLRMPAMIKLPSGRTVSCATENFPQSVLGLALPMSVAVEAGSPVSISIFHGHRELVFTSTVLTRRALAVSVRVPDAVQRDYESFAFAVLSRGPEWPKWLPGRNADHPLPKWMTTALIAATIWVLDFATDIGKHLRWARLSSWIQLWKIMK